MKKFTQILESKQDLISSIEDVFWEFKDMSFDVNINCVSNHYTIILKARKKQDWFQCFNNLHDSINKLSLLNLEYKSSNYISFGSNSSDYPNISNVHLVFVKKGSLVSKDSINGWKEFELYCESVLGIKGIYSKHFKIEVFNQGRWGNIPNYEGFYIEHYYKSDDEFIEKYPKYESFLRKYLPYKVDWDLIHKQGDWHNREDKETPELYPIPFNKEGIEVVETLMEMTKK
jgi:hypothetical protein